MSRVSTLARIVLPIILLASVATPALADTTGGGTADLGLDAVTITSASVNGRTGVATISGTIGCSQDITDVFISTQLEQVVGRFNTIRGWGWTQVSCSAATGNAAWSAIVRADQGKFAGGRATVYADAYLDFCTDIECLSDYASVGPESIHLGR